MTVDDFAGFYEAIHGYRPFRWQEELLKRVVNDGWPETISLPTSSGKTSAIDVAIFHLALESGLASGQRRAALRTFFVIDRRVVVDEAYLHAKEIAEALGHPKNENVKQVADELCKYGGSVPLQVSAMRGGMYRDNSWTDAPNQPTVCVSTVDQTGSRLLFRGYQVGNSSRPVHAGMIGSDSLIIVDEAHLSKPFLDTLEAIRDRYGKWAQQPPARGLSLVKMSATIPSPETFHLDESRLDDEPVLARRLRASKPVQFRIPKKKFEEEMAAAARELAADTGVRIVGVIANTVAAARAIFSELSGKKVEAVLLIGRNRPFCAGRLWERYKDRIAAKNHRTTGELLYVVATQTVEVGANIDFDALVSEAAPIDALRQRFGRLNRLGNRDLARAVIVQRPKEDVVYGVATENTWKFLTEHQPVDFGVLAMNALLPEAPAGLIHEPENGPLIFPGHLELWSQTNPEPCPDPEVAPFLHGKDALDADDVQIVWRGDLPQEESGWGTAVEAAPPLAAEALAMPIAAVRRWLRKQFSDATDIEGVEIKATAAEEKRETGRQKQSRPVLIWRGQGKSTAGDSNDLRPGVTIVVPSEYGGADEFGWNPDCPYTSDVGDEANNEQAKRGLRRPRIRIAFLDQTRREVVEALIGKFRGSELEEGNPDALREINDFFGKEFKGKATITRTTIMWPWKERIPEA